MYWYNVLLLLYTVAYLEDSTDRLL